MRLVGGEQGRNLEIIAGGGDRASNSKMPAFRDQLLPAAMFAILIFIKRQGGKEEREFQSLISVTIGKP